jgi:hypothetical protein
MRLEGRKRKKGSSFSASFYLRNNELRENFEKGRKNDKQGREKGGRDRGMVREITFLFYFCAKVKI